MADINPEKLEADTTAPSPGGSSDDVYQVVRRRRLKNRPKESDWRQQKLASFRPVLTASRAFPITAILGAIMTGIGILIYIVSLQSLEFEYDYTDCINLHTLKPAKDDLNTTNVEAPLLQCEFKFNLTENYITANFSYGLDKFYQNTRLYVASRNEKQLIGSVNETDGCWPLEKTFNNTEGLAYAPCGVIADSMFNDTFALYYKGAPVPFTAKDVLSQWVQKRKFRNPEIKPGGSFCDAFAGTQQPPSWRQPICRLGNPPKESQEDAVGNGFENVDFMVWMSPAALPHFRKPYRNLDKKAPGWENGLPIGEYTLRITYNYPVNGWKGRKKFYITSETWAGGRNLFLGYAYIVVGVFLLLVSVLFLILWMRIRYLERRRDAVAPSS